MPDYSAKKANRAARLAAGLCRDCPRPRVPDNTLCAECESKHLERNSRRYAVLKDEVFAAYGGYVCVCCGETNREFMNIDHIDGGGAEHRRRLKSRSSASTYRWLKKHDFPPGFRVLCANCDVSRGRHGYCPHEKKTQGDSNA